MELLNRCKQVSAKIHQFHIDIEMISISGSLPYADRDWGH
jgi:hypothetical protein